MTSPENQLSQESVASDSCKPKHVTKAYYAYLTQHLALYPVCPRCNALVHEAFPETCFHCGQILSWNKFDEVAFIELP